MKTKLFIFGLLFGLVYFSCEDSIDSVGLGIQPDQDKINIFDTTIYITASTVKVDSIYAKTVNGYLGEFYDPAYGNIKSGYICQFYAPETGAFPDSVINNKIDSVLLKVYYKSWIGDSLTPMEVTVYPVDNALNKHYYTNMDPAKYCDLTNPWAKQGYTARNLNVSDSLFNAIHSSSSSSLHDLTVKLPNALGEYFFNEFKKPAPNAYSTLEDFVKFFPGVYLTTTYGSGNMLFVNYTDVYVYYNKLTTVTGSDGQDSTYVEVGASTFNVTKEVIQLNSFKNSHDEKLLIPNDERTYLKTPAGVFTQLTIPIPEIVAKIGKKKFSSVKLTLSSYGPEDWKYALSVPNKVLLISPDSVKTFFEEQRIADSKTSYTSVINTNYAYNFNNIANVIQDAMDNASDRDLVLMVIPVATSSYTSSSSVVDYATSHYLKPSGVTLKKGGDNLKLQIVATDMDVDQLKK